ncbi:hypothetical protein HQ560_01005 [bacterium]|nr:hypothetical protein [bacterium]
MLPAEAHSRVVKVQRRCNMAVFVRLLLTASTVYLVAAGCLVLASRLFLPSLRPFLIGLAPCALLPAGAAWLAFRKRRFGVADAEGIADRLTGAGGLLLSLSGIDDDAWETHLSSTLSARQTRLPRLRFAPILRVLPYAAFLALVLWVPQKLLPGAVQSIPALEYEELKAIESDLELLAEEELLPPKEAESLKEEVERMIDSAKESHEARWEAIDTVREKLSSEIASTSDALAAAEMAAASGTPKQLLKALQELAKKGLTANMPPELADRLGPNGSHLSAEDDLAGDPALNKAMRKYLAGLARSKLGALKRSGVLSRNRCKGGMNLDDFDLKELEGMGFGQGDGDGKEGNGLNLHDGWDPTPHDGEENGDGKPGRGGLGRGRGDAPMVWGDESDEQKVKFTPKELPPVSLSPGDDMPVVGIDLIAPEDVQAPAAAAGSRVTDFGKGAGGDSWRRRVSPRHRASVRRYFSGARPPDTD